MYITREDIKAAVSLAELIQLTNDIGGSTEPDWAVVDRAIAYACEIADGYLMGRSPLPLDAHPQLGNNAQLAEKLDWVLEKQFGEQNLLNTGRLKTTQTLAQLSERIEAVFGRKPTVIGDFEREIKRIAWCSGGAQGFFQTAVDEGVDAYLTGEISEAQYHLANETGVAFISAGHHATERYGVRALGDAVAEKFGIEVVHFDENNPA